MPAKWPPGCYINVGMLRPCLVAFSVLFFTGLLAAQDAADRVAEQAPAPKHEGRLFGIIPNNRTSASLVNYKPLTAGEKFKLATSDALDAGTFVLAAAFAGEGQLKNSEPSFGQGVKGYAHYFVTSYADWSIGDYMTEAVVPTIAHLDPRYFRKVTGGVFPRLAHAVGQIFIAHTDSGGRTFNFSEFGGNAAAVAISQAYYPDKRDAGSAASKLVTYLAVDMSSNMLKEFYPDIIRLFSRKHPKQP